MPFSKGKFVKPGAKPPEANKTAPDSGSRPVSEHGKPQASQGGHAGEKHVQETHPGATQPHPTTGVHAFSAHHTGGGKMTSHTHHDDGSVDTKQHDNEADAKGAMDEAFPSQHGPNEHDEPMEADDYSDALGGSIGGAEQAV
jgi:hypothetical protein